MGRAITNAVAVAEILKRRVVGLHQITDISESTFDNVYEPLVEGLKVYVFSFITLFLCLCNIDVFV